MAEGFIPAHGGYGSLVSYQKAEIVFDATFCFCDRFLGKDARTSSQMVQAARSGKQNIIEGSMASGVSKETELRLTNVARASLEELLGDYRDYLRARGAAVWAKDSKEALYVRRLSRQATQGKGDGTNGTNATHGTDGMEKRAGGAGALSPGCQTPYDYFRPFVESRPPEVVTNIIICLIHQANYLLDRQLRQLERAFIEHGGMREAMTRARLEERDRQRRSRDEDDRDGPRTK